MIYSDLTKAFDKVDYGVIYHKLHGLGIVGKLGEWLQDFKKDKCQVVITNEVTFKNSK